MPNITSVYPEYQSTARLDELRRSEYSYLDSQDHVYLDYTGSGLAAAAQVRHHQQRLAQILSGNPHSSNPTSAAATEAIDATRARILAHVNASPAEYTVIFTPNATGAARLVGEAYPFRRGTRLVLTADNHNSINGIREFARVGGAKTAYIPLQGPNLRVDDADVVTALSSSSKRNILRRLPLACRSIFSSAGDSTCINNNHPSPISSSSSSSSSSSFCKGLFAYPAQSNYSGVRHPLSWIPLAQRHGYHVLLDAAAYLPTSTLDLSSSDIKPDFVLVSWYKLFGYPTGVGCLIARRDSLEVLRLRRPWFSGGTIQVAATSVLWHRMAPGAEAFEDGTVNFLSIPDVQFGLDWLNGIGIGLIETRVRCLTGWFMDRLLRLRHSDGSPMVRVYGPTDMTMRGGTVTFNFLDAAGKVVDERMVALESAAARISLRTGCFCNPGAGEASLGLDKKAIRKLARIRQQYPDMDAFAQENDIPALGAVRVSFGVVSTAADVDKFFGFAEKTYKDRVMAAAGLPPRELNC
ncbi:PLP-dependent transferase [Parathielavia appendiculata]|uniref:PLP-dependent transferase n=1 Tax=Parathielavia appendiculata TaxID=2587402 RepID=A0AAN6Z0F7_9PEZI|nr:PLP-dependent transferase [Parathielavia appendiculata]